MEPNLHTTHTINIHVSAYVRGIWAPLPYESRDEVFTCHELALAVRTAGRITSALIRPARFPAWRVEARGADSGRLIALSEYRPTWEPGRRWAPLNEWIACESGLCMHMPESDQTCSSAPDSASRYSPVHSARCCSVGSPSSPARRWSTASA